MFADECDLRLFGLTLVFFCDWHNEVRDMVEVGYALVIGVIRNNQRNLAMQFATLVPVKQILQAMVILRNENSDPRAVGGAGESPIHLEVAGDGSKSFGKLGQVKIKIHGIELYSRKKKIGCLVSMLIGEQDVAVVTKNKFGDRSNHSLAVG